MDHVNISLVSALEKFAPDGLRLWNVFLPKPDVPPAIAANYRQVRLINIILKNQILKPRMSSSKSFVSEVL